MRRTSRRSSRPTSTRRATAVARGRHRRAQALEQLEREPVRLVVLDLNLPDMDGIEVCRQIRARSNVPVVDPHRPRRGGRPARRARRRRRRLHRQAVLAQGARRAHEGGAAAGRAAGRRAAAQPRRRRARSGGRARSASRARPIELRPKEFDLLAYLMQNRGVVVSRDALLESVWGYDYAGGTRTVDVHVAQLRRKLRPPGPHPHGARRRLQGGSALSTAGEVAPRARASRRSRSRCSPRSGVTLVIAVVLVRRSVQQDALHSLARQAALDRDAQQATAARADPLADLGLFFDTQQERLAILSLSAGRAAPAARRRRVSARRARRTGLAHASAAPATSTPPSPIDAARDRAARARRSSRPSDLAPFTVAFGIAAAVGAAIAAVAAFLLARARRAADRARLAGEPRARARASGPARSRSRARREVAALAAPSTR